MRTVTLSILALALPLLGGCVTLHAEVPESVVRHHMAQEEGIELAALCSHEDRDFSEGAATCMAGRRMVCDPAGRWTQDGDC